jgi:hypothetical protein
MSFQGFVNTISIFGGIKRAFGLLTAIRYIYYFKIWYGCSKKGPEYIKTVLDILKENMTGFIDSFSYEDQNDLQENHTIWVCWWQGEELMPFVCKSFYEALKRNCNNEWKVRLITKDNYCNYANIPLHIIEKYQKGTIKIQQFSDILRQALLFQNGGLWMDITLFTIPGFLSSVKPDLPYWSANLGKIVKNNQIGQILTGCKWSSFLQYGKKGNVVNKFVLEGMCSYYEKYDITIDYFLQNYFIRLGYEMIPEIGTIIDSIPVNNPHLYELSLCIGEKYNEKKWLEMTQDTTIFKLTYKVKYNEYTTNNAPTFYHHVINV